MRNAECGMRNGRSAERVRATGVTEVMRNAECGMRNVPAVAGRTMGTTGVTEVMRNVPAVAGGEARIGRSAERMGATGVQFAAHRLSGRWAFWLHGLLRVLRFCGWSVCVRYPFSFSFLS